jgi:hypothetical protein
MSKVLKVILGWLVIVPLTFIFIAFAGFFFQNDLSGIAAVAFGGILLTEFIVWYGIIRIESLIQNPKQTEKE